MYIHGFNNCVTNIIRDAGGTCSDGGVVRDAYSLASQLETSGKNALLLAPEVEFEAASGDPGNLKYKDTFRALLQETLDDLTPVLGARTLADVGELIVASHSGGYTAADDIVDSTGITAREVWMLDSLYSSAVTTDFESWVKQDLGSLYAPYRRFATFYPIIDKACSGTDCNSETMASDVRKLYPAATPAWSSMSPTPPPPGPTTSTATAFCASTRRSRTTTSRVIISSTCCRRAACPTSERYSRFAWVLALA